ncbi:MAG: hypothetical protein J7M20_03295 [Deltaproteobacteria bacterium]|nr:hypothetical protein [Deltaproteobacteria bacterium]
MTDSCYWILDYSLEFSSDFHVGAGITLLGGNYHGLHLDARGFPCIHHTEIRGLLRLGGQRLLGWDNGFEDSYRRNFGRAPTEKELGEKGLWSYTSARFPGYYSSPYSAEIMGEQSHIKKIDGVAENLFSYQKSGRGKNGERWFGRIYSLKTADIEDAAFMFACMRAEDRVGHRRSRGYGKVTWKLEKLRSYSPGGTPSEIKTSTEDMLRLAVDNNMGRER